MARKRKTDMSEPAPAAPAAAPPGENGAQCPRRPVATFKCSSGKDTWVEVAVWENEVHYQNGEVGTQHVACFSRSYKNGDGWKTNHSYRVNDLMILQHLLQRAFAWMADHRVIFDRPVATPQAPKENGAPKEEIPF